MKILTMIQPVSTRIARRWPALFMVLVVVGCGSQLDTEAMVESETPAVSAPDADPAVTTTTALAEDARVSATSTDPEPNFVLDGDLDLTTAEINDMVAFVEESAGRVFLDPPVIQIQSVEEFEAGLAPDDDLHAQIEDGHEIAARFHQALGATTLGVDALAEVLADLGTSTEFFSGRYDPADDKIIIPEGVLEGDDFNAILVHELLHALDGQYVDLGGFIERLEALAVEEVASDSAFQIAAVIEGRASVTQFEWMMANNVMPSQQEVPESFEQVPASVINSVILPYQLGAQSIVEQGGVAATWDLYENLPESSEQMIFPSRIGTDAPVVVPRPPVDGEVFSEGVHGAEGMLLLGIGDDLEPSQVDVLTTIRAAEGWGGDYFVLAGDETRSCLTGSVVADTETDFGELRALFAEWAERETVHATDRTVTIDGNTLTISSCALFIP